MTRGLQFGFVSVRFVVFVARGGGARVGAFADSPPLLSRGQSSARRRSATAVVSTVKVDETGGVP